MRHASQGYRLIVALLALLAPAVVMYPSLVFFQEGAEHRIVESEFAQEVLDRIDADEVFDFVAVAARFARRRAAAIAARRLREQR